MVGNLADRAFGEILGGDVKAPIETRPEILPRDGGSELDKALVGKRLGEFAHHGIRCLGGGSGQRLGVGEHEFLEGAEDCGFPVPRHRQDFLLVQSCAAADGRADVESEYAAHERGHL